VSACRRQTEVLVDDAHQILLHYGAESSYPADLGYFQFRMALHDFRLHGCRPRLLGGTMSRRLTRRQRAGLLSHLPSATVRYLRRALAYLQP
jgi:hypothetical protein